LGRGVGDRVLLTPREPLLAGGAAEAFERQLQQLLRSGRRTIVIDLSGVASIDSAGIRALVRGHTTAQRVGGRMRLAAVPSPVRRVLELANLANVFESYESLDAARFASMPWKRIMTAGGGVLLCVVLVWVGLRWPLELTVDSGESALRDAAAEAAGTRLSGPFYELAKLVAAALIGLLITAVHQPAAPDRPMGRSMAQAQTLLCVSGAMMMIIIGNSLARAFGIAGAASIIRFRTPVEDPKDVTILFLLMGLGMSAGLGAFAVAGLGTAFLCVALLALDRVARQQTRLMSVEIVADGRQFPSTQVEEVFARNHVIFEPREIVQSDDVTVTYHAWLDPRSSLADLSTQLMSEVPGLTGVAWEHPKRA
jgi:anti-anti-sigma factor